MNEQILRQKKGAVKPKTLLEKAYKVLKKKKERLPKTYQKEKIFNAKTLEVCLTSVRDGVIEDHRRELEIYEKEKPERSDLLVNSAHHLGQLRAANRTAMLREEEKYPGSVDKTYLQAGEHTHYREVE